MRNVYLALAFVVVLGISLLGFRGTRFTSPPMDVFPEWAFPGMKHQPKLRPQSASPFFADGRADRPLPANVVSRDPLRDDDFKYLGKDASGAFARGFPASVTIDAAAMTRGRERYTIYCAPCHGALGDGNGVVKQYGVNAASFQDEIRRQMTEGAIYNTITNGSQTKVMLPYADKITPDDRWAIVAYVRSLQRAQNGTAADIQDAAARKSLGLP